jgi:hypothetical protein
MTNVTFVADTTSQAHELRVLVYSDDRRIRDAVMTGLGRRPAKDLPKIEFIQVATEPVVKRELKAGNIDLAILDGEAAPAGGMGIARNAKDEVFNHCFDSTISRCLACNLVKSRRCCANAH